ncbi:MAG: lipid-A-disaccharide synthase [Proteobacteria bacterium]|nr:lipid-A-disaccharide synthase [Pseudomonadota bacterium]
MSGPSADFRKSKLILIVAGEASADLHGSHLVRAIKRMDPDVTFWGIGGKKMEVEGVKIIVPSSEMAVVGLTEVLSRIHVIIRAYRKLKAILKKDRPDLLILIDYPDFNISLAGSAKRFKIPVLYYIGPQVWAWRRGRVRKLARRVDRMAVILPFEEDFYRKRGMVVTYVGHPLMDEHPHVGEKSKTIEDLGLENGAPIIGLLPGSRREEVINLLPAMIGAAEILHLRHPDLQALLPLASTLSPDLIEVMTSQSRVPIKIYSGDSYKALSVCDLALVASGTATLETAIMGVPMVILYKVSRLSYWIGRMVIRVPYIGLTNLVAGREIVPELIQDEVTPEKIAQEALAILEGSQVRENMVKDLRGLKERVGKGPASEKTAKIALEMMTR